MNKAQKILIIILLIQSTGSVFAQDPQFLQFYAAPTYICPSYAGSTDGSRAVLNYRNQWPAIPGAFVTTAFSLDHYFPKVKSGVGLIFNNDKAGSGRLRSLNIGAQYCYNISITRTLSVRPGLQLLYTQRSVDFNKFIFGDQLSFNGIAPVSTLETPATDKVGYIDFTTSVLVFSEKQWGGITIEHMLEPNQSLTGSTSKVPVKIGIHGGAKLFLKKSAGLYDEEYIAITANYRHQEKFDQLDLGGYWFKRPMIIGLWYRGIPLLKSYKPGYFNHDALVIMAGLKYKNFVVGYSYDFTISRLISSTGGSHEISVIYEFNQNQRLVKKRKKIVVPCPKI
ncbi:MAG: PorP/SprF family type IX secretion system membrane protein [Bacteroidia bacterium]|nr:PorP/SprF family type IX secretion system membrane protein [Bacteroidia bacterium]